MKFSLATLMLATFSASTMAARGSIGVNNRQLSGKGKGKGPMCPGNCDEGFIYWKYVDFSDMLDGESDGTIPWTVALEETPTGCILAPVESADDLLEIRAAIPVFTATTPDDDALNAWIGVVKAATDVADSILRPEGFENFMNLDGSDVPADSALWATGEPNNDPDGQTRVHYRYDANGLRDLNNDGNRGPDVFAAVYKCCYELCTAPDDYVVIG